MSIDLSIPEVFGRPRELTSALDHLGAIKF
jgi:hypothetical protein